MKNIFVGNLSFGATEAAIRSMFEQYGAVQRVNVVTDRDTGQARGFAFVEMGSGAEADLAIAELNGRELHGRALKVNEARPKPERGSGPENAGHARLTLFVGDLDVLVEQIAGRGIDPAQRETYSNGVSKITYRDADGKEVGLGGVSG
jgi:RNA recognition motif-containing protein